MTGEELKRKGVYLDNAATSYPKPDVVAEEMMEYLKNNGATSARGAYKRAIEADKKVYEARKYIAKLFHCGRPGNIVFTMNVTEALNLALQGILMEGDHVITSSIEHNAVWRCLKTLERDRGIEISTVKADSKGNTKSKDVENEIRENTKLIVFNHASNVIGTIQPIREIGRIAAQYQIPLLVDSAQTAGVYPIDMKKDHISLLAFTGHKGMLGPTGTGGLVIGWDGEIHPLKQGGTGGDSSLEYQPEHLPDKYEAGTMNVAGIIGLRAGVDYLLKEGIEKIREKEKALIQYTIERLSKIEGVMVYGNENAENRTGAVAFNLSGVLPERLGNWLDQEYNIAVRTGLHCAPSVHKLMGTEKLGAVRVGIGYQTTKEEIDYLAQALEVFAGGTHVFE